MTATSEIRTSTSILSAPLADIDPDIAELLGKELDRQRDMLEMIASENFVPRSVLPRAGHPRLRRCRVQRGRRHHRNRAGRRRVG